MANTEMIRDYIRASGYKMQYVARALKISPNALNLKLQGRTQFKLSEAERLSAVLGLSMYERDLAFLKSRTAAKCWHAARDEKRRAEHDKRAEKSDAAGTVPVWDAGSVHEAQWSAAGAPPLRRALPITVKTTRCVRICSSCAMCSTARRTM